MLIARLSTLLLAVIVALAAAEPAGGTLSVPEKNDQGGKAAAAAVGDWTQFRGPGTSGFSADQGINQDWKAKPPKELWRVPMKGKGFSGPAAASGAVFIIDHEGSQDVVRGLRLADGKEGWRFPYADTDKDDHGFVRSTPAIDQGKVYTLGRLGQVHCLDAKTGAQVWEANLVDQFSGKRANWDYAMSPIIDGNAVILVPGGDQGAVLALDKATGALIWRGGGTDAPGYATPIIATIGKTRQYLIFTAKNLIGVETASGKLLWSFPWSTAHDVNAATPIPVGESVFITSGYGVGCAMVDVADGSAKARWQNKDIQSHFNSPVLHQGFLYGTSDPNQLVCLDAQTGAVKWKTDGFGKGGLVAIEDVLVVEDGKSGEVALVKLSPDAYTELGRIKPFTGGHQQFWTPPVIADKKLLLREQTELACYDLR
jgi:outer membrane protein assembly factor BamB